VAPVIRRERRVFKRFYLSGAHGLQVELVFDALATVVKTTLGGLAKLGA